jgi:two-component system alkaline phosphatase synthesis response regulator PhoP
VAEKKTILVVDDEQDLLDLIEYNLEKAGFDVLKAENGLQGMELIRNEAPDLILLDIMMPEMNGMEMVRAIRNDDEFNQVPVIFLTAREDEKTEITALDKGGDDYVTKPISPQKLTSRIKAVLRRVEETGEPRRIKVHDLEIDKDRYLVIQDGQDKFELPRKEFDLLYFLAFRKGRVLDRQTLLDHVWGDDVYVVDRTVDVHVRKIRSKLGSQYIETVKGVGYRFKA